ncbi:hypothetical protein HPG69_013293 [Diceros bicornis minor]|uniref:Uncharacterized protein n=1 Tax=Diceros bicornis minor TaxID=77932 RepID=A0A7J7F502_DICBM|nr:hypothetical protein HPG69_013293 [Diceros bicornis minor]
MFPLNGGSQNCSSSQLETQWMYLCLTQRTKRGHEAPWRKRSRSSKHQEPSHSSCLRPPLLVMVSSRSGTIADTVVMPATESAASGQINAALAGQIVVPSYQLKSSLSPEDTMPAITAGAETTSKPLAETAQDPVVGPLVLTLQNGG